MIDGKTKTRQSSDGGSVGFLSSSHGGSVSRNSKEQSGNIRCVILGFLIYAAGISLRGTFGFFATMPVIVVPLIVASTALQCVGLLIEARYGQSLPLLKRPTLLLILADMIYLSFAIGD